MRNWPWKKIFITSAWILFGAGVMVVLGAAMSKKGQRTCKGIEVVLKTPTNEVFIDEKDIQQLLEHTFHITGTAIGKLPLRSMELLLENNPWIADAEIFVDNNDLLHAKIEERQPIARIFTIQQNSFYIDSSGVQLPLSEKMVARVPVFTDFPSDQAVLSVPDSLLMQDILAISRFIAADSFWMAQASQIAIVAGNQFEIYPLTGRPIIRMGNGSNLAEKFHKLDAYFRSEYFKLGYTLYPMIDVQYNRQLIGIRNAPNGVDSTRFYQAVQGINQRAAQITEPENAPAKSLTPPSSVKETTIGKNSGAVGSVSKEKNIQKNYNKSTNPALSNEALLKKKPVSTDKKPTTKPTVIPTTKPVKKPTNP
jgi:cell division protein FtsQ